MGTKLYNFRDNNRSNNSISVSFTSEHELYAAGGAPLSANTIDERGLTVGAGQLGWGFDTPTAGEFNDGGQITIEIEAPAAARRAVWGGPDQVTSQFNNQVICSWSNAAKAASVSGRAMVKQSAGYFTCQLGFGDTERDKELSTWRSPDYGTLRVAWDANNTRYWWNGNRIGGQARVLSDATLFERVSVGSREVAAEGWRFIAGSLKNFQISADGYTPTSLARVAILGDSVTAGAGYDDGANLSGAYHYAHGFGCGIQGYMNLMHGLEIDLLYDAANDPNDLYGYGGHGIHSGQKLGDKIATMLADSPDIVVLASGLNDVVFGQFNRETLKTTLYANIESIMAGATVEGLVITTSPTPQQNIGLGTLPETWASNTIQYNDAVRECVKAWNANNPGKSGRVQIADVFTALGGVKPVPFAMAGQVTGTNDDFHPSVIGHELMADVIAPVVYRMAKGFGFEYSRGPRAVGAGGSGVKLGDWRR